ncbi:hypothetical protein B0H10DRAFT_1801539 [Mycena sp. CBHHK59/15]|nr:hypothetical protein B0H10DRAFT_1801539 [Mycena sp. CBHHK59/15]
MSNPSLSYDLLLLVLDVLGDQYDALYQCTLVNWEFNRAASRILYSRVVLSPAFSPTLSLKRETTPTPTVLSSACLQHNAPHVLVLRIRGYLSQRPPSFNPLPDLVLAAVRVFTNLHTVELTPGWYNTDLFTAVLIELKNRASLADLCVNLSCTDETRAPLLVQIGGLRRLELKSPGRAILQLLPDWLARLTTLEALHLTSNCGSVTPGVLRFFLPHLANVTSFSLGLSYSITDEDLFTFLGQLPCLETLELQYYLQLNSPRIGPRLPRLHSFTARHPSINTAPDTARLCSWIRRIIARAPLVHLRLLCGSLDSRTHTAHVALTGLVEHLAAVHTATLRTLDLGGALLGVSALTLLYGACTALEELRAGLGVRGFVCAPAPSYSCR